MVDIITAGVFGFRVELNAHQSGRETETITVCGSESWVEELAFAVEELPADREYISAVLIRWDYWE